MSSPAHDQLLAAFAADLQTAATTKDIESLRVKFLGKKGEITNLLKELGKLDAAQRPAAGAAINKLKEEMAAKIDAAEQALNAKETAGRLAAERIDVTMLGLIAPPGRRHPVNRVYEEIAEIFKSMGFFVADGPEVELEYYNFEALNIPAHHPARDMQDTFFVEGDRVLRTHTSPVQIRVMENMKPPIKAIMPGRVYRRDADVTHSPMFHQIEGLVVDTHITFADLKGTLNTFVRAMFGERPTRFRPSFFPFTEPSAEMDIQCVFCSGKGCNICKQTGWMELGGCGMVNPRVFEAVKYDTEKYTGFAFGFGLERIAMQRYDINDIRLLFNGDVRFLRQF